MMVPKTGLEKQSLLARGKVTKQLYQKPFEQDPKLIVLGRDSPTVGIAGGYIAGGGHGSLSSSYGMAVDDFFSFGVVTAAGVILTTNADEHPHLL
ncbi:MAG: hypothetical protein MMC23_004414 [Stictis urceolatum]|nr:hypothetical protein [Stictis urceolata]